MTEYTIAAIPTVYRGRTYRSRLEARWAAFFDRLGWQHEYEPLDLGSWSPDFLLRPINCEVLVEVKPLDSFSQEAWDKVIAGAGTQLGRPNPEEDPLITVLVTAVAPAVVGNIVEIGWLGFSWDGFKPRSAVIAWLVNEMAPEVLPFIVSVGKEGLTFSDGYVRLWFDHHGNSYIPPQSYSEHTLKLWAEATSAVQWRGRA